MNQIGQSEDLAGRLREFNRRPPSPKIRESINPAHFCHDVDAKVGDIGSIASKMNGMASIQKALLKGRQRDDLGFKIFQSGAKSIEVGGFGKNCEIGVATKLRRAV